MMHYRIDLRKLALPILFMSHDPRTAIQSLMDEQGLSQRRLAELSGVDQPTLSKYLTGVTTDLKVTTLMSIAEALNTTAAFLIGEASYINDPKIVRVLRAMESMPEYKKDAVVATSSALSEQSDNNGATAA